MSSRCPRTRGTGISARAAQLCHSRTSPCFAEPVGTRPSSEVGAAVSGPDLGHLVRPAASVDLVEGGLDVVGEGSAAVMVWSPAWIWTVW